nr:MAG TPA: hypothetical protein [Bacteriophage sp.]
MKACGHHEEVDGYWCFVETARGKLIFHQVKKMKHGGMKKATLIRGYQGSQRTISHE